MDKTGPVTQILHAVADGDSGASAQLLPLVYDELRRLATDRLRRESAGQTIQPTALVHEAYLRLVDVEVQQQWDSRGHFFAAAAEAMRRILVERARERSTEKRGGELNRLALTEDLSHNDRVSDEILSINSALELLQQHDPQSAELVKLRFFAGFAHQEAAEILGISRRTADRLWATAKAWMYRRICE